MALAGKKTAQIGETETLGQLLEHFVDRLTDEVAHRLEERGTISTADVSPCLQRKESKSWHDEEKEAEFSDHTPNVIDGESSWSEKQAQELLKTMRQKEKRSRSSGRSTGG